MQEALHYGWIALQWLLIIAGLMCTGLGLLTIIQWFQTPKAPSDDSNRINNVTSWWIGLTRPEVMAHAYKAFRQDVLKNIEDVEKNNAG